MSDTYEVVSATTGERIAGNLTRQQAEAVHLHVDGSEFRCEQIVPPRFVPDSRGSARTPGP